MIDRQPDDPEPLFDDSHDSRMARNRSLPPRGPKSFRIERAGTGIRIIVQDWPHDSIETAGSGTFQFLVYWAEDVDQTTQTGVDAGFKRALLLSPAIPTAGPDARSDQPLVAFYSDPKYLTGYFYVVGQTADGQQSAPGTPTKVVSGAGGTIPLDVEHFQASESGERHGLTVLSVVSYSFRIPSSGGDVDHIQFMFQNYPNLNEFSEGESVRVTVGNGGTQTGKLRLPVGRRIGEGFVTITGGVNVSGMGTNFLSVAAAAGGDQVEIFGVRARISSVASNIAMTLSAPWSGPDVTAVTDWQVVGSVTIYAVAEAFNGARRDDVENAPSVTLDLDGELSAPVAPTLTATSLGNAVRLVITPPAGTELARALLYKIEGSSISFDKTTWQMIHPFEIDSSNPAPWFQFDDTDFTSYQREQGVTFCYAATVVNAREQESDPSSVEEATARLDAGGEGSDGLGKLGLKNLLYNGAFGGTAGNVIAANDTSQDAFFNTDGTNLPGKPYNSGSGQAYGTGRLRGYTRWEANDGGTGAAGSVKFQNGNEAHILPPGVGKSWFLYQEGEAWDSNAAVPAQPFIKMKKDGFCSWAVKLAKVAGGAQPNGTVGIYIELYDNNTFRAQAPRRYRDSATDGLLWATGLAAYVNISGADLLSDWQIAYGIFKLDSSYGTIRQCRFNVEWIDGSQGTVRVCEAMVNDGEERGVFTTDMGDTVISWPRTGTSPGPIGDGDGHRKELIVVP